MTALQAAFVPTVVRFEVEGIPEPQGSARGFVGNGRAGITVDNPDLKAWRREIDRRYRVRRAAEAKDGMRDVA